MNIRIILVAALATIGLASPAAALPPQAPENPGSTYVPADSPAADSQEAGAPQETPTAENNPGTSRRPEGAGAQGKGKSSQAPGRYCAGQSKKPVKGERGSAFSRCVKAMRKAAKGKNPTAACKSLKGSGKAYGKCVSAAAQLQEDQEAAEEEVAEEEVAEEESSEEQPAPAETV